MELTEEGIQVKNVNSEYFRAWNATKQMRESKYYFYIFILKRVAIIIPKRVFFSSENMKQFRSTLNLYLKK